MKVREIVRACVCACVRACRVRRGAVNSAAALWCVGVVLLCPNFFLTQVRLFLEPLGWAPAMSECAVWGPLRRRVRECRFSGVSRWLRAPPRLLVVVSAVMTPPIMEPVAWHGLVINKWMAGTCHRMCRALVDVGTARDYVTPVRPHSGRSVCLSVRLPIA